MSEKPALNDVLNPQREITLTTGALAGRPVTIKKLLLKDRQEALDMFGRFLQTVAVLSDDGTPTQKDVEELMPQVIAEVAGQGFLKDVIKFFGFFVSGLSEEDFGAMTDADIAELWREVYGMNRFPFASRLTMLERTGILKEIRASVLSLFSVAEQDTIPTTETPSMKRPSQSPKRKRKPKSETVTGVE